MCVHECMCVCVSVCQRYAGHSLSSPHSRRHRQPHPPLPPAPPLEVPSSYRWTVSYEADPINSALQSLSANQISSKSLSANQTFATAPLNWAPTAIWLPVPPGSAPPGPMEANRTTKPWPQGVSGAPPLRNPTFALFRRTVDLDYRAQGGVH